MNANHHLKFELSFLEIYNEKVTDLLATPVPSNEQPTTTQINLYHFQNKHVHIY